MFRVDDSVPLFPLVVLTAARGNPPNNSAFLFQADYCRVEFAREDLLSNTVLYKWIWVSRPVGKLQELEYSWRGPDVIGVDAIKNTQWFPELRHQ